MLLVRWVTTPDNKTLGLNLLITTRKSSHYKEATMEMRNRYQVMFCGWLQKLNERRVI